VREQIGLSLHYLRFVGLSIALHNIERLRRQRTVGRIGRQRLGKGRKVKTTRPTDGGPFSVITPPILRSCRDLKSDETGSQPAGNVAQVLIGPPPRTRVITLSSPAIARSDRQPGVFLV
jgi:hypothetical protein